MKPSTVLSFLGSAVIAISLGQNFTHVNAAPGDCFVGNTALSDAVNSFVAEGCETDPACGTVQAWGPIQNWCTSQVTSMQQLFAYKSFNGDISSWDTSAVTDMAGMFIGVVDFNQDISGWDTSAVTDMSNMFAQAEKFNHDISRWDTSSVTTMRFMFAQAYQFNQDISSWDISSITNMEFMLYDASSFNQDLCQWKGFFPFNSASSIFINSGCSYQATPTDPSSSFCAADMNCVVKPDSPTYDCFVDKNALSVAVNSYISEDCETDSTCGTVQIWGPIKNWCTSQVTSLQELFSWKAFNGDISGWDTSMVTNMNAMFFGSHFNQDISSWDTSAVTDMSYMFLSAETFNQDISGWDTSSVQTMMGMFQEASQFNQDISGWDISSVTNMEYMFDAAASFNQDLCPWKDNFPFNLAGYVFGYSGCTFKDTPTDPSSSFCAAINCVETTNSPTNSPSKSPTHMPTTGPSKKPSSNPSIQPSIQPSSEPSLKTSHQPSNQPSSQPSCEPSLKPSHQPSSKQSNQPSSEPSPKTIHQPSSETSSHPSLNPSELPSLQPFSEPLSNPSFTPSASSSPAPSAHLLYPIWWYPDWEGDDKGCISDGNEPPYMSQNNQYLFSTKANCCQKHYSWNLVECMGSISVTSEKKYYPDWLGDDTCKNDGAAPSYMVNNPTMWLHDTLSSCCTRNYGWKIRECMNGVVSGLFYPDWAGTNKGCLNDGNEPNYMAVNPTQWMHSTLDSCCKKYYFYDFAKCTSSASSGLPNNG